MHAEGRDQQSWCWYWVSLDSGFAWVLQVRTVEREPSPDDREWARRVWHR